MKANRSIGANTEPTEIPTICGVDSLSPPGIVKSEYNNIRQQTATSIMLPVDFVRYNKIKNECNFLLGVTEIPATSGPLLLPDLLTDPLPAQ